MTRMTRQAAGVWIACLAIAAGGCTKTFWVRQYPAFYDPELKTVAVVPFYNETDDPRAGEVVAHRLAAALTDNGTYAVLSPRDLRAKMSDEDVEAASKPDYKAAAETLKRLTGAQAFIAGAVTEYKAVRSAYRAWHYDYYPYRYYHRPYYRHGYGYRYYRPHYPYYPYYPVADYAFVSESRVAAEASMVRVSDGSVIHATPQPVRCTVRTGGYSLPPGNGAVAEAVERLIRHLVRDFAIVPVKVKVNPGKDFRTAAGRTDGQWEFTEDFHSSDETMYVVLRLPPAADRNAFRLTITPKGREENVLAAHDFTWSRDGPSRGFAFSPQKIAAGMGPGKYSANFYAGGERVMSRKFEIK